MEKEKKCKDCKNLLENEYVTERNGVKYYRGSSLSDLVTAAFSCNTLFESSLLNYEVDDPYQAVAACYPSPDFGCILWKEK